MTKQETQEEIMKFFPSCVKKYEKSWFEPVDEECYVMMEFMTFHWGRILYPKNYYVISETKTHDPKTLEKVSFLYVCDHVN